MARSWFAPDSSASLPIFASDGTPPNSRLVRSWAPSCEARSARESAGAKAACGRGRVSGVFDKHGGLRLLADRFGGRKRRAGRR